MNLSAIFKSISLIASLLPLISGFVQQIEAALPGVPGATKLQAVTTAVLTYLNKIEADIDVIAAAKTELAPIISGLVAAFNLSGLFKKAAPAPAPVAVTAPPTVATTPAAS